MEQSKRVFEVTMIVAVDCLDDADAEDMILDLFGEGESGWGVNCLSVNVTRYK